MNEVNLEYIGHLKPKNHRPGKELVQEGLELGKTIKAGRSGFIRSQSKYSNHMEYKKDLAKQGKIYYNILLGLATLDDQIDAIKKIYEFTVETGLEVNCIQAIPSGLVALPREYREQAPATTSFEMFEMEDYEKQASAAPLDITFNDYHLFSPNALENTVFALQSGSPRIGDMTQFFWSYNGFDDEEKRLSDVVKALGIMASKRDEMFAAETYLDDGYPGYFLDCTSYVGYALLEHYICSELCGARYTISFGGLLSENDTRAAVAMALDALMSTEEQPVLTYLNSSTNLQWDHHIHGNYGISVPEFLFEMLVEKKYHMSLGVNPVSITEKIKVPTLDELINILTAAKRTEEKAEEWLPYFNFKPLEEMRDVMIREGKILFENVIEGFKSAGIDTEDPLEMLMVLKGMNPIRFEQMFHSSTYGTDKTQVAPFYPTVLGRQTMDMMQEIIDELLEDKFQGRLEGKKVVAASGDAHTYGLVLVEGVLNAVGAEVINGGVDMSPVDMLDLADEENTLFIGISCHNGQALDYARQLLELGKMRNKEYWVFMGGKLNAILPGESEPEDVSDILMEMGIHAENDIRLTVKQIGELD